MRMKFCSVSRLTINSMTAKVTAVVTVTMQARLARYVSLTFSVTIFFLISLLTTRRMTTWFIVTAMSP